MLLCEGGGFLVWFAFDACLIPLVFVGAVLVDLPDRGS